MNEKTTDALETLATEATPALTSFNKGIVVGVAAVSTVLLVHWQVKKRLSRKTVEPVVVKTAA